MKLTTKTKYALQTILYMSTKNRIVNGREIALELGVGYDYPNQLCRDLAKSGIIRVIRGAGGGYQTHADTMNTELGYLMRVVGDATHTEIEQNNHNAQQIVNALNEAFRTFQFTKLKELFYGTN